jgi:hypothetical protein
MRFRKKPVTVKATKSLVEVRFIRLWITGDQQPFTLNNLTVDQVRSVSRDIKYGKTARVKFGDASIKRSTINSFKVFVDMVEKA